ncbi:MAG: DUF5615 family PIN-like protein [Cyanobacteria bacterium P01_A01_bin.84]
MKLKLDENIDVRVVSFLGSAGHDVATVSQQGLTSAPDEELIDICSAEGRCLVTCDRGFGNRIKYNHSKYSGIVIIRLPPRPKFENWREAIETLIKGLESAEIIGKLWIIRNSSIQEYQPIEEKE